MKFAARAVAIAVMGSLLFSYGFAEDAAKASNDLTKHEASDVNASVSATAVLETGTPVPPQAKKSSASSSDQETPKGEIFAGYSYIRFNMDSALVKKNFPVNGGSASITGNLNHWFGLVGDFGVYRFGNHPPGTSAHMFTYLFGPRFSVRDRSERWTPFLHTLFGAARIAEDPNTGVFGPNPGAVSRNAFALALGGGLDLKLTKRVAWRTLQAEYLLTKFADGGHSQQNNLRITSGLVFRFGGGGPPPPPPNHPPVVTASANPTRVFAGSGDSAVVQAQASDPDNDPLTYTWSASGGAIEGTGAEVRWNSNGVAEGSYTMTVKVDDGKGGTASASTGVRVEPRPNRPPTINCTANPATVEVGQRSNISATANDPDNDPLTYSYTASGGQITGSGANVQLETAGVAPGSYTVNCHVDDGRGGTADSRVNVTAQKPKEQIQLEARLSLHSIYFPTAQPTVAKPAGGLLPSQETTLTVLAGDFKRYLVFKPDARLTLQGHADLRGGAKYNQGLSDRRVERTKSFLVEKGVPADKVDTQGLGEEPLADQAKIKAAVEQDAELTSAQKAVLTRNVHDLALAQSRRVDVTLPSTGQTSQQEYPFNAADALNLIDPKGIATRREEQRQRARKPAVKKATTTKKTGTAKAGTTKAGTTKKATTKKATPKK
jgi:outer membrane protein OmpA-like peptidoglycan-associated protein